MIETRPRTTTLRRVPVCSPYSETREPTAEMLRGLDPLVIDLQDVGTRIYTYIYTMANCMRAAKQTRPPGHRVRPSEPHRRRSVEGPMLRCGFESFVGLYPLPMRHGMTIGELARLFNEAFGIGADLEVIAMEGWARDMYFDDDRHPVRAAVAQHPDARLGRSCTRERCCSKAPTSRKGAARRDLSSSSARRGSTPSLRRADERSWPARSLLPPARSNRRFTNTQQTAAAAARFTCSIATGSARWKPASP